MKTTVGGIPLIFYPDIEGLDNRINLLHLPRVKERPVLVIVNVNFIERQSGEVKREDFLAYVLAIDDRTGRAIMDSSRLEQANYKNAEELGRKAFAIEAYEGVLGFPLSIHSFIPEQ